DRAARAPLTDHAGHARHLEPRHDRLRARDRRALSVLLRDDARVGARRVHERDDRKAVPLGELHRVPGLAVPLRVRHPEATARALVDVATLLLPDEDDRAVAEPAEAGDHRAVVTQRPVAVELEPVVEQALDVVERVGAVVVAGQLALAPDLLVGRLLADSGDLPLEPVELAGDPRAAEQ